MHLHIITSWLYVRHVNHSNIGVQQGDRFNRPTITTNKWVTNITHLSIVEGILSIHYFVQFLYKVGSIILPTLDMRNWDLNVL